MSLIFKILVILFAIYILIAIVFYFFQHLFFFRPEKLHSKFTYKYPFPFEEHTFEMEDGGLINSIYFRVPNRRGVIFYLKGNSRSIKGWGKFAKDFLSNGYDFFMMDYRGFGKSKGRRTQEKIFNDVENLYSWLLEKYTEDKIVLYGRSWGSGVAAYLAGQHHPRMLILDSPYLNFYYTIHRYLPFVPLRFLMRYDIRTDEYLSKATCPIHIIHGTKDRLIPYEQSLQLKNLYPGKITLHPIEGAKHNNLPEYKKFFEVLYDVLYLNPASK